MDHAAPPRKAYGLAAPVPVGAPRTVGPLRGGTVGETGHRFDRRGLVLAGAAATVLIAVYVVALGASGGQELDDTARADLRTPTVARQIEALDNLLDYLWVPYLLVAALACWYVASGRRAVGIQALALLFGTTALALALRWMVFRVDPLGGESQRPGEIMYFPSGHATVAAVTGLALVVLAPAGRRVAALVVAGAGIAAVGVASVVEGSHYPSDVLGAYALALAAAFLVEALVGRGMDPSPGPAASGAILAAAVSIAAVVLAVRDGVSPRELVETGVHGAVAALLLAVLGAAVPLVYVYAVARSARSAALAAR